MKIIVYDYLQESEATFQGDEQQLRNQLLDAYPWLKVEGVHHDIEVLIGRLGDYQFFGVETVGELDKSEPEEVEDIVHQPKDDPRQLSLWKRTDPLRYRLAIRNALTYEDTLDVQKSLDFGGAPKPEQEEESYIAQATGLRSRLVRHFAAAQFLSGGQEIDEAQARYHLYTANGDVEHAALRAYGLVPSKTNKKALRSILSLNKQETPSQSLISHDIEPAMPEAAPLAESVKRGVLAGDIRPVKLDGKHIGGTVLVRDASQHMTYILKPGAGGQSPAAGVRDTPISQPHREAAFFHVAKLWQMDQYVPHVDLVLVGGTPWAAGELLTGEFRTIEEQREEDPSYPVRVFHKYLDNGTIFKWATLDWVLGNPDRHLANTMSNPEGEVRLIDHGSAFAGRGFRPGYDSLSFIPGYLRYTYLDVDLHSIPIQDRVQMLPRVSREVEEQLTQWVRSLDLDQLEELLRRYSIDPEPMKDRLVQLQNYAATEPVDLVLNEMWAGVR